MRTYKNYRYLLSFAFILAITSCGKTIHDYAVWGEFRYYNKTASNILLKLDGPISGAAHKVYSIAPNDSLVLKTSGETNEKYAESWGYRPPVSGDTTTIVFRDTLCYKEFNRSGPVIQNIAMYKSQRKGDRDFLFFFTIDSTLLSLAVKCQ